MSGSIMPTPLASPTTRAGPAQRSAVFGRVSVVMMARATSTASARNSLRVTARRCSRSSGMG